MSTRAELIFSVKELLKEHTDDSLIADEHIMFQIKNMRAMLLRQLYSDRAKRFDASVTQSFCIGMEVVDNGLCGARTNCTVLRSVEKIPGLLSVKSRSSLTRVGPPVIGTDSYDLIDSNYLSECLDDEYAGHSVFLDDDYLYLVGNTVAAKLIKCVRVSGVFEDPEDLEDYDDTCEANKLTKCFTAESDYPIPGFMASSIIQEVVKPYIKVRTLEEHRDTDNNAAPE